MNRVKDIFNKILRQFHPNEIAGLEIFVHNNGDLDLHLVVLEKKKEDVKNDNQKSEQQKQQELQQLNQQQKEENKQTQQAMKQLQNEQEKLKNQQENLKMGKENQSPNNNENANTQNNMPTMTQENASQSLDALKNDEKMLLQQMKKQNQGGSIETDKDW